MDSCLYNDAFAETGGGQALTQVAPMKWPATTTRATPCDDASCLYLDECGECGGEATLGCTDDMACNFDAEADCDDESCLTP